MPIQLSPSVFRKSPFKRAAITFAPALLMAVIGLFTFATMRAEEDVMRGIHHSNEISQGYVELLADVRDLQTAVHAFVITGSVRDYGRFAAARAEIERDRTELRATLKGSELQRWRRLEALVSEKLAISARTALANRSGNSAAAIALLTGGRDVLLVERIAALVEYELANESRQLQAAMRERGRYIRFVTVVVPLTTLLVAMIALLVNNALSAYAREEEAQVEVTRALNEQLMRQSAELEAKAADLKLTTAGLADLNGRLLQREARFRALIENSHDIVAIIDTNMRLSFVSPSVERVLGYAPEELVGKAGAPALHPDDIDSVKEVANSARGNPDTIRSGRMRLRHKNGEWRLLDYSVRDKLIDPAVQGLLYNARDVTDEQQLQEQLLQSQKMEAVGRLAGGIAHDFNNLMTAVSGNLSFALESLAPDDPACADLQEVQNAVGRASALTRQLLAFSRKQVLEPRVIDIRKVIEEFEKMIRRVLGERITLDTVLPDEPLYVKGDHGQVEQVIMNLVVNARDAMPAGGKIVIKLDRESGADGSNSVVIAISDTGVGMPPEIKARIFEPFYTTKPSGEGTGLGLAMVYGIVKQSGGSVEVESAPGRGTTFHIRLPLIQWQAENAFVQGGLSAPERGNETILVVEDEATVRALTCRALRAHGYQVVEASSGQQALDFMSNRKSIDLLLTDAVMPGIHGLELAEIVAAKWPDTRIILMSGYSDADMGEPKAAVTWLEKPFTLDGLRRLVRHVLDNNPQSGNNASHA